MVLSSLARAPASPPVQLRARAVSDELAVHSEALSAAMRLLSDAVPASLSGVHFPVPGPKVARSIAHPSTTTLVPFGLGMVEAVRFAISLGAPFRALGVDDPVLAAVVKCAAEFGSGLVAWRTRQRRVFQEASLALRPLSQGLRRLQPPHLKGICKFTNFGLIEALVRVSGLPDSLLMDSCLFGFQSAGDVFRRGTQRACAEPERAAFNRGSNWRSVNEAARIVESRARRDGRTEGGVRDQRTLWSMVMDEVEAGFCTKPLSMGQLWCRFKGVAHGARAIPSFLIWQKEKPRRIDDCRLSGTNLLCRMYETISCVSADLPAQIAQEFAKYVALDSLFLRLGTDDVGSAYRVVPCSTPEFNVAAVWRPASNGIPGVVRYVALFGFNFGLKSAPVALAAVLAPIVFWTQIFFLVPCGRFYDDVVVVDQAVHGDSAQVCAQFLFAKIGFPFAARKHEKLRSKNPFLGVAIDFSFVASGFVVLSIKESRRQKLLQELRDVLSSRSLTPAQASRLRGKLYFTTTSAFGGVGRPALQAFTARQYARASTKVINDDLEHACKFFIVLLSDMPPVRVPLLSETSKPVVVWSDAMWELARDSEGGAFTAVDEESGLEFYVAEAVVAFTVWDPESSSWYHSYRDVTVEVLRLLVPGKMTYIGQLEALAFACVQETFCVHNLQHVFYDRQVYAFVDNISAKFGLQKGYSKRPDTAKILNACKVRQASLLSRVWFEWVPTHQNLADLPSRGGMEEFFRVIREATGVAESRFLDLAFPNFSSWEAPLEVLVAGATKKRRRPR